MPDCRNSRIRIRQASPNDFCNIMLLVDACISDLAGTSDRSIIRLISERTKMDLKLYPRTCLVACDGEVLAGFSLTEIIASSASVLLLTVDPRYRRRGVGSALVSATISRLEDEGVEYVELMTPLENKTARSFWTSKGFMDAEMRVFSRFLSRHEARRRT